MIHKAEFSYRPSLEECEKASYAYVVSTVVIAVALPIPIALHFWLHYSIMLPIDAQLLL
ncbi:hypothetical protein [Flavobacterium sp. CS20]|uniref:hypothetical protein n=1 Tax=Flavobacterium sp. CS20 TaxID=2775246 RepID=UPI001B39F801|nr:hypothetical protein [Flavobacterium sp. CS20]QTY26731.1 hypothetical protein IGB25_12715 [Flavobacterium sp. CS20]